MKPPRKRSFRQPDPYAVRATPCAGLTHRSHRDRVVPILVLAALICTAAIAPWKNARSQTATAPTMPVPNPTTGFPLWTSQALAGEALYYGTHPFADSPRVAGAPLPRHAAACASCHGALGEGDKEGSIAAPDIRGLESSRTLLKAVVDGVGADGHRLTTGMPRYALTAAERAALSAFVPWLGRDGAPVRGVDSDEIRLGLTLEGIAGRDTREQIQAGLADVLQATNERGGVHGRQIRLRPLTADAAQGAPVDVDVFALIASAPSPALRERLAALRLPSFAGLAFEREDVGTADWTVPLLPSLRQQIQHALRTVDDNSLDCERILYDPLEWVQAIDLETHDPLDSATRKNDRPALRRITSAEELSEHRAICLVAFAPADAVDRFREEIASQGSRVSLLVELAWLRARPVIVDGLEHRLVLPTPVALTDLAGKQRRSLWFVLGQAAAHAGVEALAASGRVLQPEHALARFRSLTGFEPIAGAPLQFGNQQSHGWLPQTWPEGDASSRRASASRSFGASP